MSKIALLFPGQGSQFIGMGKEFFEKDLNAKKVFLAANNVLDLDISNICFNGPEDLLKKTINTQPAILTASIACLQVLESEGIKPDYLAGHSLGEYSALVVSKSISFEDAVMLVRKRGKLMEEAYPEGKGKMLAILGLETSKVEEICTSMKAEGIIQPANYNCPGQIVVSGENEVVTKSIELFKEAGAKRVVELAVSGPFHSQLMEGAGRKLKEILEDIHISKPQTPVFVNYSAQYVNNVFEVKESLVKQISNSVRWEETILNLIQEGVETFIEVGPGKVLCGLVKKICKGKNVTILNVQDIASLKKTINVLKGV